MFAVCTSVFQADLFHVHRDFTILCTRAGPASVAIP